VSRISSNAWQTYKRGKEVDVGIGRPGKFRVKDVRQELGELQGGQDREQSLFGWN